MGSKEVVLYLGSVKRSKIKNVKIILEYIFKKISPKIFDINNTPISNEEYIFH